MTLLGTPTIPISLAFGRSTLLNTGVQALEGSLSARGGAGHVIELYSEPLGVHEGFLDEMITVS